jgi:hypothetical protein
MHSFGQAFIIDIF